MPNRLNREQKEAVSEFVEAKVVYDLGAGDGASSYELLNLGAAQVFAVDKTHYTDFPEFLHGNFEDLLEIIPEEIEVAYVSWPVNWLSPGLRALMNRADILIYVGSNTNGNACGHPLYFKDFMFRSVLAYVPSPANTLIIYGPKRNTPRALNELHGEELAGLTIFEQSRPLSFEEAENLNN